MKIILFDVDNTLTPSGKNITKEMTEVIAKLSKLQDTELGVVGGGTSQKISNQLLESIKYFKYIFAECGSIVYIDGILHKEKNILDYCDRNILNEMIRLSMIEISKLDILFSGCQIDFRRGLVSISPPGFQASDIERNIFIGLDSKIDFRNCLIDKLKKIDVCDIFDINLGGEVSISILPRKLNKSQVIEYLIEYDHIYFFGDKCEPNGNDYPLYSNKLVDGYSVKNYHHTIDIINNLFFKI